MVTCLVAEVTDAVKAATDVAAPSGAADAAGAVTDKLTTNVAQSKVAETARREGLSEGLDQGVSEAPEAAAAGVKSVVQKAASAGEGGVRQAGLEAQQAAGEVVTGLKEAAGKLGISFESKGQQQAGGVVDTSSKAKGEAGDAVGPGSTQSAAATLAATATGKVQPAAHSVQSGSAGAEAAAKRKGGQGKGGSGAGADVFAGGDSADVGPAAGGVSASPHEGKAPSYAAIVAEGPAAAPAGVEEL